jgi:hypothetical protein
MKLQQTGAGNVIPKLLTMFGAQKQGRHQDKQSRDSVSSPRGKFDGTGQFDVMSVMSHQSHYDHATTALVSAPTAHNLFDDEFKDTSIRVGTKTVLVQVFCVLRHSPDV